MENEKRKSTAKSGRRSSILKPPKARNPLSDLDFDLEQQNVEKNEEPTNINFFDKNKRVSFSSTKVVSLFTDTDHGNTIWHGVYEEPNNVNVSESIDMAETLIQKLSPSVVENNPPEVLEPKDIDEQDDHCMNISAMLGNLAKLDSSKRVVLESTNPSIIDHTDSLINFKITDVKNPIDNESNHDKTMLDISQEESSCEISIQISNGNIETNKMLNHLPKTIYANPDKENWIQEKENINTPLNIKYEDDQGYKHHSSVTKVHLNINTPSENNSTDNSACETNARDPIAEMIDQIESKSNFPCNNASMRLKRKATDDLDEILQHALSDKRKTLIFDRESPDSNMSLTSAIPTCNLANFENESSEKNIHVSKNIVDVENKRKSVVFNQSDNCSDMSITNCVPDYPVKSVNNLNIDEEKYNDARIKNISKNFSTFNQNEVNRVLSSNILPDSIAVVLKENNQDLKINEENKTILLNETNTGCYMSITNILSNNENLPNSNIPKLIENEDRRTIIFNQKDSIQTLIRNSDSCVSDKENTKSEKRKTIIFDVENADMSITNILPHNISNKENEIPINIKELGNEKRKTIIFNPEFIDCNMSMTTIQPSDILSNNKLTINIMESKENEKHKTIIFNQENVDCNMSMTTILPSTNTNENHNFCSKTVEKSEENKRKTIIFNVENADMSMTNIHSHNNSNKEKNVNEPDNEKRKTIIFEVENADMSITNILPHNNSNKENAFPINMKELDKEKRRTIIFEVENADMSMTNIHSHNNSNKENAFSVNMKELDEEKRKTIIFTAESADCNMSMTTALPSNIFLSNNLDNDAIEENKIDKRKTIIFNHENDDCNMSMTSILPSIKINQNHNLCTNGGIATEEMRKTIIFDVESADMSITSMLPHNISNKENTFPLNMKESGNEKRKTIIFAPESADCNMSMTNIQPSNILINNKTEIDAMEKNDNNRCKTIIFNQENDDCHMSMTSLLPSNNIDENLDVYSNTGEKTEEEKRKTIIFNVDNADMSMTNILPHIISNKQNTFTAIVQEPRNEKRKTIIFSPESIDCNMSMTTIQPSNIFFSNKSGADAVVENKIEKRKTIILNQENDDCNMSMTNILSSTKINENEFLLTNTGVNAKEEKRKTVIFNAENADMSITNVLPNVINIKNELDKTDISSCMSATSEIKKTYSHNPNKSNVIISSDIPSNTSNKENFLCINIDKIENEKRKTIIFDENNANMSTPRINSQENADHNISTMSVPIIEKIQSMDDIKCRISSTENTRSENQKTIIFNQQNADMSMKKVLTLINSYEFNKSDNCFKFVEEYENVKTKSFISNKENEDLKKYFRLTMEESHIEKIFDVNKRIVDFDQKKTVDFVANNGSSINKSNCNECSPIHKNTSKCDVSRKSGIFHNLDFDHHTSNIADDHQKISENFQSSDLTHINERPDILDKNKDIFSISINTDLKTEENIYESVSLNIIKQEKSIINDIETKHSINKLNDASNVNISSTENVFENSNEVNLPEYVQNENISNSNTKLNTSVASVVKNSGSEKISVASEYDSKNNCNNITNPIVFDRKEIKGNLPLTSDDRNMIANHSTNYDCEMEISYFIPTIYNASSNIDKTSPIEEQPLPNPVENRIFTCDNISQRISSCNEMKSICEMSIDYCDDDMKSDETGIKKPNMINKNSSVNLNEKNSSHDEKIEEDMVFVQKDHTLVRVIRDTPKNFNDISLNQYENNHKVDSIHEDILRVHGSNVKNPEVNSQNEATYANVNSNIEIPIIISTNKDLVAIDTFNNLPYKSVLLEKIDKSNISFEEKYVKPNLEQTENMEHDLEQKIQTSPECVSNNVQLDCSNHIKTDSFSNVSRNNSVDSLNAGHLSNISNISFVNTSVNSIDQYGEIQRSLNISECDKSQLQQSDVMDSENVQPLENESGHTIEDVLKNINSLKFNKLDCSSRSYDNEEWSFSLCVNSIVLKIRFCGQKSILNSQTPISDIILERSNDADMSPELFCAQIAMMNQLIPLELLSQSKICDDVPHLLLHCADVSKKARKFIKVLKFLYLQHGLQLIDEKLTLQLPNALLRCIWEFTVDIRNLPFVKTDDITINVVCGKSPISTSALYKLIDGVDHDWDYIKNMTDILFCFFRDMAKNELLS